LVSLFFVSAYDVAIYAGKHKRTFILKPYSAGQGRGIWITTDLRTVGKREKLICQTYIERVCPNIFENLMYSPIFFKAPFD